MLILHELASSCDHITNAQFCERQNFVNSALASCQPTTIATSDRFQHTYRPIVRKTRYAVPMDDRICGCPYAR